MEPKSLSDKQLTLMLNRCGEPMRSELRSHIVAVEAEHRALVADNAALLTAGQEMLDSITMGFSPEGKGRHTLVDDLGRAVTSPHPGAALLSEMEALRNRVAELEDVGNAYKREAERLASERDEARAHADALALRVGRQETLAEARRITISTMEKEATTARAAALEEAATRAKAAVEAIIEDLSDRRGLNHEWQEIDADVRREIRESWEPLIAERIRALATTPPPPVVPVAKVREVLRLFRDHKTMGDRWTCNEVANRLGISLDGEP